MKYIITAVLFFTLVSTAGAAFSLIVDDDDRWARLRIDGPNLDIYREVDVEYNNVCYFAANSDGLVEMDCFALATSTK